MMTIQFLWISLLVAALLTVLICKVFTLMKHEDAVTRHQTRVARYHNGHHHIL